MDIQRFLHFFPDKREYQILFDHRQHKQQYNADAMNESGFVFVLTSGHRRVPIAHFFWIFFE